MTLRKTVYLLIFLIVSIRFSLAAEATSSRVSIEYTGQEFEQVELSAPKAVTKYRTRVVHKTCSRSVPYQERECHTQYQNERYCYYYYNDYRCEMRSVPREVCENVTRYRQETYACTETIREPYTVYEGTHRASIKLNFIDLNKNSFATINLELEKSGAISINALDKSHESKLEKIILLTNQTKDEGYDEVNDINMIEASLDITMLPKADYVQFQSVPVTLAQFDESSVTFKMGKVTHLENAEIYFVLQKVFHSLMIKKINLKQAQVELSDDSMLVTVPFDKEILPLSEGEYKILINQQITFPGHLKVLNTNDIEIYGPQRYWFKFNI